MTKATVKELAAEHELLLGFAQRYPLDWVVVYCNPKCEPRALAGLMAMGILAYLPQRSVKRKQGRGKQWLDVNVPMFTRYLFAGVDRSIGQSVDNVRACDGVEGIVSFAEDGAPLRLRIDDLCRVVRSVVSGEKVKECLLFEIGDAVRIIEGPFTGFDLTVSAYAKGMEALRGDVSIFGRDTTLTLEVDAVRAKA